MVFKRQDANEVTKLHGVDHKEILENCIGSLVNLTNERERPLQFNEPIPLCYHPFYPNRALNSTVSDQLYNYTLVIHDYYYCDLFIEILFIMEGFCSYSRYHCSSVHVISDGEFEIT